MTMDDEQSFAALLAESEAGAKKQVRVKTGDTVRGRVIEIGSGTAFVNIGAKAEAIIDLAEFKNADTGEVTLAVGDEIEARVTDDGSSSGAIVLKRTLGRGGRVSGELEQAAALGIAVEGTVTGQNKGGYDVQVAGLRAFCPGSQIDVRRSDPATHVGQRYRFKITKLENNGRNVVVSRRLVLEEEAAQAAATTWQRLHPGAVVSGTVVSLRDFGAFVDLGGVEGLVHLSELGHARPKHPSDVLTVGQRIEVQVLKAEPGAEGGRGKVSLSLRALAPDPWAEVPHRYPVGTVVKGTVRRLEQFGAFVELEPGIEGLVHVSQMTLDRRIAHARQGASEGQAVEVTVTAVDPEKKRLSLSMTAQARRARDDAEAAEVRETATLMEQSNVQGRSLGTFADLLKAGKKDGGNSR